MATENNLNDLTFHNGSTYEEYVLGNLSKLEEDQFEEHMITCAHCREQLEITESIVLGIKNAPKIEEGKITRRGLRIKSTIIRYSIAASITLFLGISTYFYLKTINKQQEIISNVQQSLVDSTLYGQEDNINPIKIRSEVNKSSDKELLALAYKTYPIFENAIENQLRSSSLEIIKPTTAAKIKSGEMLSFEWKYNASTLLLVIFNNKGEIIFQKEVQSPIALEENLKKGLYYWQLENSNESLFTGKFLII